MEQGRIRVFDTHLGSRKEIIAALEGIPLKDWWRNGEHKEFGTVTLKQQVSYFAAHELGHLRQINAVRSLEKIRYLATGNNLPDHLTKVPRSSESPRIPDFQCKSTNLVTIISCCLEILKPRTKITGI